ncbi:MAG: HAD hydrolase family protein, partial [Muribaculaceae bacterium]|nr:HAD hydrolase family protein [Muribaculaceae bacterium]
MSVMKRYFIWPHICQRLAARHRYDIYHRTSPHQSRQMKYLFITDMDGTLLNEQSKISLTSAQIISDLSRQGALITV